jgi:hypothetical protein
VVVALQGSLDDFALPDVLALLASTKKTGELHVSGERGGGRLWLRDGEVVWAEAGEATDAVDCIFELLRATGGQFRFTGDVAPPAEWGPAAVEPLIAEATVRLGEWVEIERVVPSLATAVRLEPEAPGAQVVVSADQWRALVAVAEGGTVAAVGRALGAGEFGACRAVKELVDAGLVAVVAGPRPAPPDDLDALVEIPRRSSGRRAAPGEAASAVAARAAAGEHDEEAPAQALVRQLAVLSRDGEDAGEPGGSAAEPGSPVAASAGAGEDGTEASPGETASGEALVDENGEPINRSLLLKFLSSVRS